MNINQEDIQRFAGELGSSFVGFSNVNDKLPESLKKYPFAITIGIRLSDAIIDEISDKPTFTYFHHYRTVNALIDQITLRLMLHLMEYGYKAYAIPASQTIPNASITHSAIFPHKTAAVQANLGWIGKNGLFISKDYGPGVRLGTILTDMPFIVSDEILKSRCRECRKCVDNCPAMALTGDCWEEGCDRDRVVDANACSEFMKVKFKNIGRGSVCGVCISVCPFRK